MAKESLGSASARISDYIRDLKRLLRIEIFIKEIKGTFKVIRSRVAGSFRQGNLDVDRSEPIDKKLPFWREFIRIEKLKDERLKELNSGYIAKNVSGGNQYSEVGLDWLRFLIKEHGLSPECKVFDYGCGGFRLGAPVINFLEAGKYTGFDITDFFFENGGRQYLENLGIGDKVGEIAVTSGTRIASKEYSNNPDMIFSMNTLMHVGRDELDTYFFNISHLASDKTKIFIDFLPALWMVRKNSLTFAYSFRCISTSMKRHGLSLVRLYGNTMLIRKR